MDNEYENIMSLVEEVRDILTHTDELSERKPPKGWKGPKSYVKGNSKRNPFRGLKPGKKVLGFGPGKGGIAKRKHTRKNKWACNCTKPKKTAGHVSVCHCAGKDGAFKTVRINKVYKDKYNDIYNKWRGSKKKRAWFAGGGKSPFKKRA